MRKILFILLSFLSIGAYSQTNTYSPYSRYGLGDLAHEGLAFNRAMGGTGIALRLPNSINYLNPASYTAQDTMSFIFDFGLYSNYTQYKTNTSNSADWRSSLSHIVIGFPITKWWKSSLGLVPYSRMGYNLADFKIINYANGSRESFDFFYNGTGGVNKFYFGNAIKLKNLSVGVNLNVLFGSLEQTHRFSELNLKTDMASTTREQQQSIRSTSFTFGLQYDLKLTDDLNVIVGGTMENKSRLVVDEYLLVTNVFAHDTTTSKGTQTIYSPDTVDFHDGRVKSHLPMRYGAGLTINFKNKLLLSADYSSQKWSDFQSFNPFDELADSRSLNFGLQYTPDEKAIRNYWKRIGLRAGFYTSETYMKVKGEQLKEYGVTCGLRFPFKGNKSAFQISYEFGKRGTTNNGLIQENVHSINLGITLHDFWFIKSKYD